MSAFLQDWDVQSQKEAQARGQARTRGAKARGARAGEGRLRDCPAQRGPPGGRRPRGRGALLSSDCRSLSRK